MSSRKKKIILTVLTIGLMFAPAGFSSAQDTYPKLANYYLKYFDSSHYNDLMKWDLIIMPTEMVYYNEDFFSLFREKHKGGLLINYVYPAMAYDYDPNEQAGLQRYLYEEINRNNWWLYDAAGKKLEIWPNIYAVNVVDKEWRDFNICYLKNKIKLDKWDGVIYDIVDSNISFYNKNGGGIDINGDGNADDAYSINWKWQEGMAELFKETRGQMGDKLILINGDSLDSYQPYINGRMFETFPTPWEGNGRWEATMGQYLEKLPAKNVSPQIYILNANTNNTGKMDNYRKVRFGLSSALLGDGYFSFDSGDQDHAQVWWYDEYDANLGKAKSAAYNLLDKNDKTVKPGLWRRDFANGIAVVNSTDKEQKYAFSREEFEKINGAQDRRVNDGSKVNWVKLAPNDGIVLLKINTEIKNNSFKNGNFIRVFNSGGEQTRNGFFSYNDNFPGDAQILVSDIDNDKDSEILANGKGAISVYDNGVKVAGFFPYGASFKNEISFAAADLNGDGTKEIITAPATGGGPHVKIFSKDGKQLSPGFFAYDKNFRGGVSIAAADLNNDGAVEIITAPASGGPHVKIFSSSGKLLGQFFAFDKSLRSKIKVMADDINGDGKSEILVSTDSFIN